MHGGLHLTVALSRSGASLEELCDLLEQRAAKINADLANHYKGIALDQALSRFNDLHRRHIDALRSQKLILAHEILGQIHRLSSDLEGQKLYGAEVRSSMQGEFRVAYSLERDFFEHGPMSTIYVPRRKRGASFGPRAREEPSSEREILNRYIILTTSLIANRTPLPEIAAALGAADEDVRRRAEAAIDFLEDETLDLWPFIKSQSIASRITAISAICVAGERGIPTLIEALNDPIDQVREAACRSLAKIRDGDIWPAVSPLISRLSDPAPNVRKAAVVTIGSIGHGSGGALSRLLALFNDEREFDMRDEVSGVIAKSWHLTDEAIPALIHALANPEVTVRTNAIDALARLGIAAKGAMPQIVSALADVNMGVRVRAALALRDIKATASQALPALVHALKDSEMPVRRAACTAISCLGQNAASAIPALIESLQDLEKSVRISAIIALAAVGPGQQEVKLALNTMLNDPDQRVRSWASDTLKELGS